MTSIMSLCSLSKNMRRRMPENAFTYKESSTPHPRRKKEATLTFRMFEIQQFEPARPLERPFEIPQHVVDLTARGVRVSETTTLSLAHAGR